MAKEKPKRKAPESSSKPSPKQGGATSGGPKFDATLAVESAAALISSRAPAAAGSTPRKESAAFRQLKESLNQQPTQAIGNLLDKAGTPGAKRSSAPYDQTKGQVGHNQTFGADVTRTGVPRRTGG
jgi:hypothetical protein